MGGSGPVATEGADLADDAGDALDQMNALLDGKGGKQGAEGGEVGDLEEEKPPVEGETREREVPAGGAEGEGEEEEEEEDEGLLDEDEEEELEASEQPQLLRDIEKKYPKLFKEFKPLRNVILRDSAFSQVFGSPREAAETAQLTEDYREFENELLSGNNEKVLTAIKATNVEGYKRFVTRFLPALQELDQNLYVEVTVPVLADVLSRAGQTGAARGDKNLVNSVKHIASLIWPSLKGEVPDVPKVEKTSPELEERERKIAEREHRAELRDSTAFVSGVKDTCNRLLRKRIEKGLDPNNVLTAFLKNSVVEKAMKEVQELLNEDERFNSVMQRTFERARRGSYSNEYRTRMVGTFIGRASPLIGPIRKRLLNAALGKSDGGDGSGKLPVRRAVGEGSASGGRQTQLRAGDIDFSRSSDLDILSGKATPRKK